MKELKEKIFERLFNIANISNFTREEYEEYERSLKSYRDMQNTMDYKYTKGRKEGKKEEKIEIAKNLLKNNISIKIIINSTGLTKEEIEKLRKEVEISTQTSSTKPLQ